MVDEGANDYDLWCSIPYAIKLLKGMGGIIGATSSYRRKGNCGDAGMLGFMRKENKGI